MNEIHATVEALAKGPSLHVSILAYTQKTYEQTDRRYTKTTFLYSGILKRVNPSKSCD
jgi:hypothetical protein